MSEGGSSRAPVARLYALLTLMVFFWALNFVIARIALRELPSLLAASLRACLAGVLLLPVYFWKGRQYDKEPWTRADVPKLLMLGVVGVTLNQTLFLMGLERTSTPHAAIIAGMLPIQVLVISSFLGLELLSLRRLLGMGIALSGVGVLQLTRETGGHPATFLGDLLVLLSGTAFALFAVFGKKMTARHGALTVNTFAFIGGGALLIPVIVWLSAGFDYGGVSNGAWLSLLYMAIFPSIVAYLIFYYALTKIAASRVSTFGYLQPLMATLLGLWLLGDQITGTLMAGGGLVLAGVFLTERA